MERTFERMPYISQPYNLILWAAGKCPNTDQHILGGHIFLKPTVTLKYLNHGRLSLLSAKF